MDHPASTNSNYIINNITTNITCMQVLTIVLLMICNGQNPGSSTSGTSHNKCSKMPPPTSKSDPCSYELFCLESHILSFSKVLKIPPESPCMWPIQVLFPHYLINGTILGGGLLNQKCVFLIFSTTDV